MSTFTCHVLSVSLYVNVAATSASPDAAESPGEAAVDQPLPAGYFL